LFLVDECLLRGWWKPLAFRRSEILRNGRYDFMSMKSSRSPDGDHEHFGFQGIRCDTEFLRFRQPDVDFKSTRSWNPSPSRRGRIQFFKRHSATPLQNDAYSKYCIKGKKLLVGGRSMQGKPLLLLVRIDKKAMLNFMPSYPLRQGYQSRF